MKYTLGPAIYSLLLNRHFINKYTKNTQKIHKYTNIPFYTPWKHQKPSGFKSGKHFWIMVRDWWDSL